VPEVVYIRQKSPALLWRSIVTAFGAVITVLSILSLMAVVLAAMASTLVRVP
jgi:hypothetical protein